MLLPKFENIAEVKDTYLPGDTVFENTVYRVVVNEEDGYRAINKRTNVCEASGTSLGQIVTYCYTSEGDWELAIEGKEPEDVPEFLLPKAPKIPLQ